VGASGLSNLYMDFYYINVLAENTGVPLSEKDQKG